MNKAERNYDVYNKELLGLREMFRHWQHYLHQAAHKVKVHTDHTNLLFWKNPGDHNRRVVRWHAELMDYDFKLVHIAGPRMDARVTDLQGPPSERTQTEKLQDLKKLA
jgi:hypothetical protein